MEIRFTLILGLGYRPLREHTQSVFLLLVNVGRQTGEHSEDISMSSARCSLILARSHLDMTAIAITLSYRMQNLLKILALLCSFISMVKQHNSQQSLILIL